MPLASPLFRKAARHDGRGGLFVFSWLASVAVTPMLAAFLVKLLA